jgi:hypothetical protein
MAICQDSASPALNLSNTAGYHLGSLSCPFVVRSAYIGSAGVRFSLDVNPSTSGVSRDNPKTNADHWDHPYVPQ